MGESYYLKKTLSLAAKAKGYTSPNPMVGAVIVKKGKIIAEGYHRKRGLDHAEVAAIKKVKNRRALKGATLYVNLEPCSHWGKTPPCTEAIIKAGIKKVVVAMKDPNPRVNGVGLRKLRAKGIKVKVGELKKGVEELNEAFIKYVTKQRPFIILKWAQTLDGKIATRSGDSKWISGPASRHFVHKLRNEVDAILVGINTVIKDNPRLTSRIKGGRDPFRIIVDSKLRIPLKSRVLKDKNVLVATSRAYNKRKKRELEKKGIEVLVVGSFKVHLETLLKKLAKREIISVLIEGGSEINASAIEAEIVDKIIIFIAPKIVGGREALSPVGGRGVFEMKLAKGFKYDKVERMGEDLMLVGKLKTQN